MPGARRMALGAYPNPTPVEVELQIAKVAKKNAKDAKKATRREFFAPFA
jgi:hypothetical protein